MFGCVKINPKLTDERLGLNCNDLHTDSHQQVVMECERCGEVFTREYRLVHKLHQCNGATGSLAQRTIGWLSHRLARLTDHSVRLECVLDDEFAIVPTRTRSTDAGYDLYSITDKVLEPSEVAEIKTGIRISAPDGWYYTIDGRSSMWSRGIITFRGIIDGGYTGTVQAHLMNASTTAYSIKRGDRIAQIIMHKINHMDLVPVDHFSPRYNYRGSNGFGSTGR